MANLEVGNVSKSSLNKVPEAEPPVTTKDSIPLMQILEDAGEMLIAVGTGFTTIVVLA